MYSGFLYNDRNAFQKTCCYIKSSLHVNSLIQESAKYGHWLDQACVVILRAMAHTAVLTEAFNETFIESVHHSALCYYQDTHSGECRLAVSKQSRIVSRLEHQLSRFSVLHVVAICMLCICV